MDFFHFVFVSRPVKCCKNFCFYQIYVLNLNFCTLQNNSIYTPTPTFANLPLYPPPPPPPHQKKNVCLFPPYPRHLHQNQSSSRIKCDTSNPPPPPPHPDESVKTTIFFFFFKYIQRSSKLYLFQHRVNLKKRKD